MSEGAVGLYIGKVSRTVTEADKAARGPTPMAASGPAPIPTDRHDALRT